MHMIMGKQVHVLPKAIILHSRAMAILIHTYGFIHNNRDIIFQRKNMLKKLYIHRFTNKEVIQSHESICNIILDIINEHKIKDLRTNVFYLRLSKQTLAKHPSTLKKHKLGGQPFQSSHGVLSNF